MDTLIMDVIRIDVAFILELCLRCQDTGDVIVLMAQDTGLLKTGEYMENRFNRNATTQAFMVICSIFISLLSLNAHAQMTDYPVPIGFNMMGPTSWSRTMLFADRIKSSKILPGNAQLDSKGWPTHDADFQLYAGIPNAAFHGNHLVYWEGKADVSCTNGSISTIEPAEGTNAYTAILSIAKNSNPMYQPTVTIHFKNTNGGVKNVKVMLPGHSFDDTFNKATVAAMKNAHCPVVRFMDYLHTNSSVKDNNNAPEKQWTDRRPGDFSVQSYYHNGNPHKYVAGSWEYVIEFSNQTGIDPWINIPVHASDDYIKKLAQLFADNLNPERKVYTEYGNENWNYGGPYKPQAEWVRNRARRESGPDKANSLSHDPNGNEYLPKNATWDAVRYAARRNMEIGQFFAEAFGPGSMNTRVRPLLMHQRGMEGVTHSIRYLKSRFGSPKNYFYATGGATYFFFFPDRPQSTEDLLAGFKQGGHIMGQHVLPEGYNFPEPGPGAGNLRQRWGRTFDFTQSSAIARYYGLKSFAYEGSNGLDGPDEFFRTGHRDPRNAELLKYVIGEMWHGTGNDLWMWFQFALAGDKESKAYGAGNFASLWYPQDTLHGKYQGIKQLMNQPRSPLTGGIILPSTEGADTSVYIGDNLFNPDVDRGTSYTIKGTSPDDEQSLFLLNAKLGGIYSFSFELAEANASDETVKLFMLEEDQGDMTIAKGELKSNTIDVELFQGMHAVKFVNSSPITAANWHVTFKKYDPSLTPTPISQFNKELNSISFSPTFNIVQKNNGLEVYGLPGGLIQLFDLQGKLLVSQRALGKITTIDLNQLRIHTGIVSVKYQGDVKVSKRIVF